MEKRYDGAPFGVCASRFALTGLHPKRKLPGEYMPHHNDIDETERWLGPGKYSVDFGGFSERAVKARAAGPGWERAYEVERIAALPYFSFKCEWNERREVIRRVGPGKYEARESELTGYLKDFPKRGACDTLVDRFPDSGYGNNVPGPGTYGRDGFHNTMSRERAQKKVCIVGMLDSGSKRFDTTANNQFPGPGSYHFKSFTDRLIHDPNAPAPFDLYSDRRDKPIISGHNATAERINLAPGQYDVKSSIDDWSHPSKNKHGKFSTLKRFCGNNHNRNAGPIPNISRKDKGIGNPGPGSYDLHFSETSIHKTASAPPFLSSTQRKVAKPGHIMGPGRYDILRWDKKKQVNGHSNLFKSNCGNRPSSDHHGIHRERHRETKVNVGYSRTRSPQFGLAKIPAGFYANMLR